MQALTFDTRKQFPSVRDMTALAYATVKDRPEGSILTYAEWHSILGSDPQSRAGRTAILRAGKMLLEERSLLLVNRWNQGYEIARQGEHEKASRRRQKRGMRQFRESHTIMVHTDDAKITDPHEKDRTLQQRIRAAMLLAIGEKLSEVKRLPIKDRLAIPSGEEIVRILMA